MTYQTNIYEIFIYIFNIYAFFFGIYTKYIYILGLALRFHIVVFVLFECVRRVYFGIGGGERWNSMTHKMMRIARYCTSVLISGRTIPVDVRLHIPLCGFTYVLSVLR